MTTMTTSNRRYLLPSSDNYPVFLRSKTDKPTPPKNTLGWLIVADFVVHGALVAFVVYAFGAASGIVPGIGTFFLGP